MPLCADRFRFRGTLPLRSCTTSVESEAVVEGTFLSLCACMDVDLRALRSSGVAFSEVFFLISLRLCFFPLLLNLFLLEAVVLLFFRAAVLRFETFFEVRGRGDGVLIESGLSCRRACFETFSRRDGTFEDRIWFGVSNSEEWFLCAWYRLRWSEGERRVRKRFAQIKWSQKEREREREYISTDFPNVFFFCVGLPI